MSEFNQINEVIEVVAIFRANKANPVKFAWQGREYKIEKLNLMHSRFEGRSKIYYFEVSDKVNYFKIKFDTDKLIWTLIETYAD